MKKHFEILDGLRGMAALSVVAFHLLEAWFPTPVTNPLHHAYLAVDFLFLLSGFVVGYAYDHRNAMSVRQFFQLRLIRLHPMVVLGVVVGALVYLLDPFAGAAQEIPWFKLAVALFSGWLLLPSASLPNRDAATHSLNGPCWSLLQEYVANIIYILFLRRMRNGLLMLGVVFAAVALCLAANRFNHLQGGWSWYSLWMAPVRVMFPFLAGLLLFRLQIRIKINVAFPLLTFLLLVVFAMPYFQLNGSYESFCILFIFPIIVATGAGSVVGKRMAVFCQWAGRISYPVYLLHYPFVTVYAHWVKETQPSGVTAWWVGAGLFVFFIVLSWFVCRFFDEPVRKWLSSKWKKTLDVQQNTPPSTAVPAGFARV